MFLLKRTKAFKIVTKVPILKEVTPEKCNSVELNTFTTYLFLLLGVIAEMNTIQLSHMPHPPGALISNHLQEAKTTEKSWSLATNSKFNAICCFNAAVLHPNRFGVVKP